jgi:DNA polymerase III subunit delta'
MFEHPRNVNSLFGFKDECKDFLNSFNSSRLHHAWLISGTKGIGKATFAYHLAKFLLSNPNKGSDNLAFNSDSPTTRKIENSSHPDLLVLESDNDDNKPIIKVEDTRDIGKFLSLTAVESRYRVVLIDCIDAMNINAANALLKLLEEPSPNVIFILVCHKLGQILPTVRSRCRLLKVQPLSQEIFGQILLQSKPSLNAFDIADLYELSGGSVGQASIFLDGNKMDVYKKASEIILNPSRSKKDIFELASLANDHENWKMISYVLEKTMTEQLKNKALNNIAAVEQDLNKLAEVKKVIAESDMFHLDKGHVVTSLLS